MRNAREAGDAPAKTIRRTDVWLQKRDWLIARFTYYCEGSGPPFAEPQYAPLHCDVRQGTWYFRGVWAMRGRQGTTVTTRHCEACARAMGVEARPED